MELVASDVTSSPLLPPPLLAFSSLPSIHPSTFLPNCAAALSHEILETPLGIIARRVVLLGSLFSPPRSCQPAFPLLFSLKSRKSPGSEITSCWSFSWLLRSSSSFTVSRELHHPSSSSSSGCLLDFPIKVGCCAAAAAAFTFPESPDLVRRLPSDVSDE